MVHSHDINHPSMERKESHSEWPGIFRNNMKIKPDVICIQETWLIPNRDFCINDIPAYGEIEKMEEVDIYLIRFII